jgi:hypothetical protein
MPDNIGYTPGSGAKVATREVSYSGETALVQVVGLATVSGPDDATTVQDVSLLNPMPTVANQSDDLLRMLSRLVKILECNAVVDQQQRQRVTIDAITGSLTLATVSAVTTVSTVNNISAGTLTNVIANAGMDREQYINIAKNTYANSIRSNLAFV